MMITGFSINFGWSETVNIFFPYIFDPDKTFCNKNHFLPDGSNTKYFTPLYWSAFRVGKVVLICRLNNSKGSDILSSVATSAVFSVFERLMENQSSSSRIAVGLYGTEEISSKFTLVKKSGQLSSDNTRWNLELDRA